MADALLAIQQGRSRQHDEYGFLKRSPWLPLVFAPAVLICGASWLAGGVVFLTDLGFGLLTVALFGMLLSELRVFGHRYGIGGILLAFGSLLFFCHDYFFNWSGVVGSNTLYRAGLVIEPAVLARAGFYHALFVLGMSVGLLLPWGKKLVKVLHAVPEPTTPNFYVIMIVVLCIIGLLPYFLFTAEPWYLAIWRDIAGARRTHAEWTVGRTGQLNVAWGAYVWHMIDLGEFGGILASIYAILIARNPLVKALCWAVWLFWCAEVFGTGSRSFLLVLIIPPTVVLFIKYHVLASAKLKRISAKAYFVVGTVLLATMFVIKYQIDTRNVGYTLEAIKEVNPFVIRGNGMFSTTLAGFLVIPEERPFFMNRFPGESLIRPIPEWIYQMVLHPIPRALWQTKPVDPLWEWYNITHAEVYFNTSKQQATISQGAVGYWYFRYGLLGVIEGAIFIGWLMAIAERALQRADGRPICILIALGMAAKLFNGYRALLPQILIEIIFGYLALLILVHLQRKFYPGQPWNETPAPAPTGG